MIGILGKKLGMTQLFREDGRAVPVTVIEAGPCYVLQVKTAEIDGYKAIQLGFDAVKESRVNKPQKGRFNKTGVKPLRFLREIRTDSVDQYKIGHIVTVDLFKEKDLVDVTGTSIGKGFQGGMKRWHWRGGPGSHGSTHHRAPGSIGSSSFPSRVFKGHHLPGRMGAERKTTQNLEIIKIDKENNLLVLKGSVPGHKNSYLVIKEAKKKRPKGAPGPKPTAATVAKKVKTAPKPQPKPKEKKESK